MRFLGNPGDALQRARELEASASEEASKEEFVARRKEIAGGIDSVAAEGDRYVRLYVRGHLDDPALEAYRDSFKRGYADGGSGLEELDYLKKGA